MTPVMTSTAPVSPTTGLERPSRDTSDPTGRVDRRMTAPGNWGGVAAYSPGPTPGRIPYIDMARGLFLILMTSTHAMTVAGVAATSPLMSLGLPRGWATTGLIMLCGFMVATFAREMEARESIRRRVLRRARRVFAVMFASNVLMVAIRHVMTHETDPLFTFRWWSRFLFFRGEWSISGILLPIGLFLLAAPALVGLYDRCRSRVRMIALGIGLLLFAGLAWSVQALTPESLSRYDALNMMFGTGAGGFPVIPMVASGALGFLLGILWQPAREDPDGPTTLGIVVLFIATSQMLSLTPSVLARFAGRTLMDVSHLVLILVLAIAITQWRFLRQGLRFVPLLGRYSLFTFLVHRVIEQMLGLSLRPLGLPSELVYGLCFLGGVFGSVELILWRKMWPDYDRLLQALYL